MLSTSYITSMETFERNDQRFTLIVPCQRHLCMHVAANMTPIFKLCMIMRLTKPQDCAMEGSNGVVLPASGLVGTCI